MTTGVPIYLVSACSSSEEFVAAFRRYVDRGGVFVPIGEPLAVGKRGRFALTLRDGRVMIEGDAEVVASFAKPSPLQGRVGMTVRFAAPDEPSKVVLAEVEKARLMPKPPATSVAPRAADVPASPRPVPPAPGGRIDATNALAECVAIVPGEPVPQPVAESGSGGNVAAWKTGPQPTVAKPAMPAIPDRPKTPTAPPTPKPELKPAKPTMLGMTPLDRVKAMQPRPRTGESPLLPRRDTDSGHTAIANDKPTPVMPLPVVDPAPREIATSRSGSIDTPQRSALLRAPAEPGLSIPAAVAPASSEPTFTPTHLEAVPAPAEHTNGEPPSVKATPPAPAPTIPPAKTARSTTPPPITAKPTEPATPAAKSTEMGMPAINRAPTIRGVKPGAPASVPPPAPAFAQRPAAPATPTGPVPRPSPVPIVEPEGEPTDLTEIPVVSDRKTALGVAVATAPASDDIDPLAPTLLPDQLGPLSASARAANEPTGDWTMTPDDSTPRKLEPVPALPPPSRPSGDWLIQVAPDRPEGWTEPERLSKAKPGDKPAERRGAVIRAEAIKPVEHVREAKPAVDEPKVQIDPTLIEPLPDVSAPPSPRIEPLPEQVPIEPPRAIASAFRTPVFSSQSQPFMPVEAAPPFQPLVGGVHASGYPTPVPGTLPEGYPTYAPGQVYPDPAGFPARGVSDGGYFADSVMMPYATDSSPRLAARRRGRILVIAISAALVVAAGLVIVVMMTANNGDATDTTATVTPPPPPVVELKPSEPAPLVAPKPAAPADAAVAPAPAICFVDLTTSPTGAEVATDNDHIIGTSPAKLELPCDTETKLYIRKHGYFGAIKPVTPTPEAPAVKVTLGRAIYSVKVSSSPAGATITVGGKAMGITPTTVKLPAYETATLIMTKDGFATEAQTLTPKTNNQTVHVSMKKKKR